MNSIQPINPEITNENLSELNIRESKNVRSISPFLILLISGAFILTGLVVCMLFFKKDKAAVIENQNFESLSEQVEETPLQKDSNEFAKNNNFFIFQNEPHFKLENLNEYLLTQLMNKPLNEIDSEIISENAKTSWEEVIRKQVNAYITTYNYRDQYIAFISFPSDICTNKTQDCITTDYLDSNPKDTIGYFYYYESIDPKLCSNKSVEEHSCIETLILESIQESVQTRNKVFAEKKASWVTEQQQVLAEKFFNQFQSSTSAVSVTPVSIVILQSKEATATVIVDENDQILKVEYSPIVY